MALTTPIYLQLGGCIIEDGTGTTDYKVLASAFPEPEPDGLGGHQPAVRTIVVRVTGTTISDLNGNIATLRREGVRDKVLYMRPSSSGDVLSCKVRECSIVEETYEPLKRSRTSNPETTLTITVTTDPYWLGAWTADVTPTVTTVPGHFDVTAPAGEVDALMRIRAVFADAGTAAAIAVKPDPGAGYDYLDDYGAAGDTSDANAVGTYKVGETVDSSLAGNEIGSAPTFDTNSNRGRHQLWARVDHNATTSSNVTMRAATTTLGSAISDSVTVYESAIAATSADLIGYDLGTVQIPAGQVPDLTAAAVWGPSAAQLTIADASGSYSSASSTTVYQTFMLPTRTRLASATIRGYGQPVAASLQINTTSSGVPTDTAVAYLQGATFPSSEADMTFAAVGETVLEAGVTYALAIVLDVFGTTAYVSKGAATSSVSAYDAAKSDLGYDLRVIITGEPETAAFSSSNPIQAACSESSKTVNLDYVQRIPLEYAAIIYRRAASGSLALYYDGDTDTPYLADADGIAYALYDRCEIRKPLRLKPGVTNRVVLGALQADEAIGGATVTYAYRPRYLTATGA